MIFFYLISQVSALFFKSILNFIRIEVKKTLSYLKESFKVTLVRKHTIKSTRLINN